ncbi:hypothetical protein ABFY54_15685 [Priestia megaterium]|uniref:Uncharacterized protein n=1 Tax=Priestia aryabhattai TaxID=412384 RepID=A0ABD5KVE7_PRIAR|nr:MULTISPECIES: hypothetical protein [Priestia]MBK0293625.1 hypothetical protein [Bacillus sp. S34]UPK52259.1 hypothetical protein MT476_11835 [Bacillus sp. H8-1]AWD67689.1 hypothetical protein C2I28_22455 [Priestia megaterium]MDC7764761.1 hypothetical protein [Priestia aryabhattai]MEB4886922.1 hypothetical protein [Priestia megaterium]
MNELVKIVLNSVDQLFGKNYVQLITYLLIALIGTWLYKEFRTQLLNSENYKREKYSEVLTILLELEYALNRFLINEVEFSQLEENLKAAYPYLSYDLSKEVGSFSTGIEKKKVEEFVERLSAERNNLKYNQPNAFSYLSERSISRSFGHLFRTMLSPVLIPFLLTLLTVVVSFMLLYLTSAMSTVESVVKQYYLIQGVIDYICFLMILVGIADIINNQKVSSMKHLVIFLIIFITLSITAFLLFSKFIIIPTILFVCYGILLKMYLPKIIVGLKINNI